eukprot:TRINITY_DN46361_c0_g1_i1.p1 TRINITY_DN46361_c0_g1~~TRINITY_DN46361_c0_g1_i1.p1  ORF type:complete len:262 (-),score=36.00 TRINITY_DN46361_c0_g1_i1:116-829(-)
MHSKSMRLIFLQLALASAVRIYEEGDSHHDEEGGVLVETKSSHLGGGDGDIETEFLELCAAAWLHILMLQNNVAKGMCSIVAGPAGGPVASAMVAVAKNVDPGCTGAELVYVDNENGANGKIEAHDEAQGGGMGLKVLKATGAVATIGGAITLGILAAPALLCGGAAAAVAAVSSGGVAATVGTAGLVTGATLNAVATGIDATDMDAAMKSYGEGGCKTRFKFKLNAYNGKKVVKLF